MQGAPQDKHDVARAREMEARVWASLDDRDFDSAIARCKRLNERHPGFASGWHTASHLATRLGKPKAALAAIDRAVALEPDNPAWLLQRGLCLDKLGRSGEVRDLLGQLQAAAFSTAYEYAGLAMLLTALGRRREALREYEKAIALDPDEPKHCYNLACLQRSLGDIEAAEANFDRTLALAPRDYEAWKIRSELRRQTPGANHVAELEALLAAGIDDPRGVAQVCYALAKELEDLGEYERAFVRLRQGAAARRGLMRYDVGRDIETMAAIRQTFTAERFGAAPPGSDNDEAIFVLGLPRTGTTLVERVLASHTDVHAAGELPNFAVELTRLARAGATGAPVDRDELVRRAAALDFRALGDAYIESTRPFTGHTPRFIDKMPLNYLYLGLIRLALPKARIVHLRRHPLDTCYAIYKQLFVDACPFSYDLVELARYYVAYDELMQHWDTVLPGVIHKVTYESLVADFETEARRLVEYCDLDWQPQCLTFYENPEASLTASTVQVRKPVYSSSVGKWRHYREQLEPLTKTLRDAGIAVDD